MREGSPFSEIPITFDALSDGCTVLGGLMTTWCWDGAERIEDLFPILIPLPLAGLRPIVDL